MCFSFPAGDSPVAGSRPEKVVLKYGQSSVSKQAEKERECCSGNSSGMGRDLAASLHLENLTGAASERRQGLLPLSSRRPSGRLLQGTQHPPGSEAGFRRLLCDKRGRVLFSSPVSTPHFSPSEPAVSCLLAGTLEFLLCVCVCV